MPLNKKIIFVVGNSRSGTTMLSRVLGNNSKVLQFQEIHFFEWMVEVKKLHSLLNQDDAVRLANKLMAIQEDGFYQQDDINKYTLISKKNLSKISKLTPINVYYDFLMFYTENKGKSIPCEQTPKNLYYINEIIDIFPNAKIINMYRDPRSILLSQKNKWKRRFLGENMTIFESIRAWTLYHPITIAKLWKSAINTSQKYSQEEILSIKFEEFIESPEVYLEKICIFCGIDYDLEMLNVPQIGSSIGKDEPNKKGIDKNKISTWKNANISNTELYILQTLVKNEMISLGYSIEQIKPNYFYLVYLYLIFPIKITTAVLLNLNRMKNIIDTLKRRMS